MGFFRNIYLKMRLAKRVGAFARASKSGMTPDEARDYADRRYPPTAEDLAYEALSRERTVE